ncbi:hypothetical protein KO498_17365 [Lentibacter algarum]|nr:hypothetical protein [Lentibacter algarum]
MESKLDFSRVLEGEDAQRVKYEKTETKKHRRQLQQGKDHRGQPLTDAGARQLKKIIAASDAKVTRLQMKIKQSKSKSAKTRAQLRKTKQEAAKQRRARNTIAGKCEKLRAKLKKATSG